MSRRQFRFDRIRAVEREAESAALAVQALRQRLQADPSALQEFGLRYQDAQNLEANLATTYLIRLYAEFEAGLREAWRDLYHRPTSPPMRDLLDAIAGLCRLPQDWVIQAHELRDYRNSVLHEGEREANPLDLSEARRRICRFFSGLPATW
jgi:hypothetical protein